MWPLLQGGIYLRPDALLEEIRYRVSNIMIVIFGIKLLGTKPDNNLSF